MKVIEWEKTFSMQKKNKLIKFLHFIGILAIIIGTFDPLEGSVLILTGSASISISAYLSKDIQWRIFLFSFTMIAVGVFFLFYFSSLGGFGGNSSLSWWWGLLIIPYPIGWLITVILLIRSAIKKKTPNDNMATK